MQRSAETFSQHPYPCRLEWGRHGARQAAARQDVLVVVDTLSFSTAVVTAVHRGAVVYPCLVEEDAAALASRVGGEVAVHRLDVPERGRFSLSPATYQEVEPGTRIVLPSPNGGTCSRYGRDVPYLFVGALVNAGAVAETVTRVLAGADLCVTVVPCGERWRPPTEDGELRVAIEDYLAAGAILSGLQLEKSPEAEVCESTFAASRDRLAGILWECASGWELRKAGYEDDVRQAARLDAYDMVPVMRGERLERMAALDD